MVTKLKQALMLTVLVFPFLLLSLPIQAQQSLFECSNDVVYLNIGVGGFTRGERQADGSYFFADYGQNGLLFPSAGLDLNRLDGSIYAIVFNDADPLLRGDLVRFDQSLDPVVVSSEEFESGRNNGAMDDSGLYYSVSVNELQVFDVVNETRLPNIVITPSDTFAQSVDYAWQDDFLYGYQNGVLQQINSSDGSWTEIPTDGNVGTNSGSHVWFAGQDDFYILTANPNQAGFSDMWRFDLTVNPVQTQFVQTLEGGGGDAAACPPLAEIPETVSVPVMNTWATLSLILLLLLAAASIPRLGGAASS